MEADVQEVISLQKHEIAGVTIAHQPFRRPPLVSIMAELSTVLSERGWGRTEFLIMAALIIGMLIPWILYIISPPDGIVPVYGIVISLLAAGYLAFVAYSYLRY